MPIFLWSTVVTHPWTTAVQGSPVATGSDSATMAMLMRPSTERPEIAEDALALRPIQAEGRHQAPGLTACGSSNHRLKSFGRVA